MHFFAGLALLLSLSYLTAADDASDEVTAPTTTDDGTNTVPTTTEVLGDVPTTTTTPGIAFDSGCGDNLANCTKWASNGFCTKSAFEHKWKECAKSCGLCDSPNSVPKAGECADKPYPGRITSDCKAAANYCKDKRFESVLRVQCPATCGFCKPSKPNDIV